MGKSKRQRNRRIKRVDPISRNENKDNETRKTKILPLIEKLKSADAADRQLAISALTTLAEDTRLRQLLLKEKLIQIVLEQSLSDSSQEVVCEAFGLLRNMCLEEGYDVAMFLYRQDISTAVEGALNGVKDKIETHGNLPSKDERYLVFSLVENVVGLISALALSSEDIFQPIATKFIQLAPFLLNLIHKGLVDSDGKYIPRKFITSASEFLYVFSEGNIDLVNIASEYPIDQLIELAHPTAKMYLTGLKYNAYIEFTIRHKPDLPPCGTFSLEIFQSLVSVLDNVDLTLISQYLKPEIENTDPKTTASAASKAVDARALAEAVEVAIDLIGAVSETIQIDPTIIYGQEVETDEKDHDQQQQDMDEDLDDDDFIIRGRDAQVGSSKDIVDEELNTVSGIPTDDISSSLVLTYMLDQVVPCIIKLMETIEFTERSLIALNNCCLTLSQRVPISDSKWASTANDIWVNIFSYLDTYSQDISILVNCVGTLGAVADSLKENAILTIQNQDVVQYLIQKSHQVKTLFPIKIDMINEYYCRTINVLTPLAMVQNRTNITSQISDFLFSILSNPIETPPLILLEALNSIFDIFGDKNYSYDKEVFVEKDRLNFLRNCLPIVRRAIKKIDRTKSRGLRVQADQTVLNLARFIDYKQHELS